MWLRGRARARPEPPWRLWLPGRDQEGRGLPGVWENWPCACCGPGIAVTMRNPVSARPPPHAPVTRPGQTSLAAAVGGIGPRARCCAHEASLPCRLGLRAGEGRARDRYCGSGDPCRGRPCWVSRCGECPAGDSLAPSVCSGCPEPVHLALSTLQDKTVNAHGLFVELARDSGSGVGGQGPGPGWGALFVDSCCEWNL